MIDLLYSFQEYLLADTAAVTGLVALCNGSIKAVQPANDIPLPLLFVFAESSQERTFFPLSTSSQFQSPVLDLFEVRCAVVSTIASSDPTLTDVCRKISRRLLNYVKNAPKWSNTASAAGGYVSASALCLAPGEAKIVGFANYTLYYLTPRFRVQGYRVVPVSTS